LEYRLGTSTSPFEAKLRIPQLHIDARYTSSGVLFILPALGGGTFNADFCKNLRVTFKYF